MKIVMLVDSSASNLELMTDLVSDMNCIVLDTKDYGEELEYNYLVDRISSFSHSSKELMITRFSGRESVARELGDELSEMIVPISFYTNSSYYTEQPINTFLDLLHTLDKETV